jgi:hypothetical protein
MAQSVLRTEVGLEVLRNIRGVLKLLLTVIPNRENTIMLGRVMDFVGSCAFSGQYLDQKTV